MLGEEVKRVAWPSIWLRNINDDIYDYELSQYIFSRIYQ